MLRNGNEVFDYNLSTIQAFNVQQKLNDIPEFNSDDKSTAIVSSGSVESSDNNFETNNSANVSIGLFETLGSTTAKQSGVRTRQEYYATYMRMGTLGLVQKALEVISDEASQKNDDNEVLSVVSNNEKIETTLHDLFFSRLSINTELWPIFYETLKMGDNFYEVTLNVNSDNMATGIRRIKYLDPSKIDIHEKDGKIDYYIYRTVISGGKNQTQLEQRLFPWQIIHFKIENKETKPYGRSLLFSGIRSYERLIATEDIFLTYTISRTPSRRVFKIDVGGLPSLEAQRAIREMRDAYRSQQVIDNAGNLNQISSILSITSDIFIPVREGSTGTQIETLQGDSMNMNQNMMFLDNFKKDLISSFNVPPEYLLDSSQTSEKSTVLSQKDIKFGRFVERVQQQIIKGLYKMATLELFFNGFHGDDLKDFNLELTPPSTIKEASEVGLLDTKMNVFTSMQNTNVFPNSWLLKKILRLSDKEISELQFMKMIEDKNAAGGNGDISGLGGIAGGGGEIPSIGGTGEIPEIPTGGEEGGPETTEIGSAGEEGGAGETEAPSAETAPSPEELNQGVDFSYLNVNGQKFLIEDRKDFMKLISYISEQKKDFNNKKSEFMSTVDDILDGKKKRHSPAVPNLVTFFENNNELGGLDFKTNTIRFYNNLGEELKLNTNVLNS